MIGQIIGGLVIAGAGVFMAVKTEWMLDNFGRIEWFEIKMGTSGGSRTGYKLIGIAFIFIGILVTFGLIGGFMKWILSPLLKVSTPSAGVPIN